jgi:hypothetical protein
MATKKVAKCETKIVEDKKIQLLAMNECCKQYFLQHVDRKAIVVGRRIMEHINKNDIREFVSNSLLSNGFM